MSKLTQLLEIVRSHLESWGLRDISLLLILPVAVLMLVYFIPTSLLEQYAILDIKNPLLSQLFLANYAHVRFAHLMTNVVGYVILTLVILAVEPKSKKSITALLAIFIVLPVVTSLVTLQFFMEVPGTPTSLGFSAIVYALVGFLALKFLLVSLRATTNHGYTGLFFLCFTVLWILMVGLTAGTFTIDAAGNVSNGLAHTTGYLFGMLMEMIFGN